jgi:hypothetical protein
MNAEGTDSRSVQQMESTGLVLDGWWIGRGQNQRLEGDSRFLVCVGGTTYC